MKKRSYKEYRQQQIQSKIGQIINDCEVLSHAGYKIEYNGKRTSLYKMRCSCGEDFIKPLNKIRRIKGCGCKEKIRVSKPRGSHLPYGVASFNEVYSRYTVRAKYKNIEFKLSKEEFKKITSLNCYYCGIEPLQSVKNTRIAPKDGIYYYNGIDRTDSSVGYILPNCKPCCEICNKAKRDLSEQDFLNWVNRLIDFNRYDGRKKV